MQLLGGLHEKLVSNPASSLHVAGSAHESRVGG